MSVAFEVSPYSYGALLRLIAERASAEPEIVAAKSQLTYFGEYFSTLGASTIVVENEYVDRDYLEDFAGYYVRCFHTYRRTAARLHFFTCEFGAPEIDGLLSGSDHGLSPEDLQKHYLGFIVVKPLPQAMIGRTCLRTYPVDGGRRQYPIIRRYDTNLFGVELAVDTFAFQEQDTVAAACATSALWSAFHGTGSVFHHALPSPVEITRAATRQSPPVTRALPNQDGLTPLQMAEAVRSVGLEPLVVAAGDDYTLKATVYAYTRAQIPPLLGAALIDPTLPQGYREQGLHAMTITGFGLGASAPVPDPDGFRLRAYRIDQFYVHDDQVGPFARMPFLGDGVLGTSWPTSNRGATLVAQPNLLILPLYHKIRIRLQSILAVAVPFDAQLEILRATGHIPLTERIEWDVYLTSVNQLKSELMSAAPHPTTNRRDVLLHSMPRFLWRATASAAGKTVLDLLFDATDIDSGPFFVRAVEYDGTMAAVLRSVARSIVQRRAMQSHPDWSVWNWFAARP